jgi:hypothetical protein
MEIKSYEIVKVLNCDYLAIRNKLVQMSQYLIQNIHQNMH